VNYRYNSYEKGLRHIADHGGGTRDVRTGRHNYLWTVGESGIFELQLSSQYDAAAGGGQGHGLIAVHGCHFYGHLRIDLHASGYHGGKLRG
jgi:hypothetical protein